MRILALLLACAWLSGCAGVQPPPLAFEVKDQGAFDSDLAACRAHAAVARPRLSAGRIATSGGRYGLQNAPGAAVNPVVPVIAALGGAASETLDELNLLGQAEQRLVTRCMRRKGDKSGAYFVLDPND